MSDGIIRVQGATFPVTPNPPANKYYLGIDISDGHLKRQDSTGAVTDYDAGSVYTDEQAQDAVGSILIDTTDIDLTYIDGVPSIQADLTVTGVVPTSYGGALTIPSFTVDTKGRLSAASNNTPLTASAVGAQPHDNGLDSLSVLSTNGLVVRTGVDTFTPRTLQSGAGISITNADGAAGDPIISSTITQYTNEDAQDAVGNILTDSADIDFTYSDVGNTITAVLTASGVTPASYGGTITVPSFTVDSKGRLTAASTNTAITPVAIGAQPHDTGLDSLVAIATNGFVARTGASTFTPRTLTAGTGITISNPTGAAGDPTISTTITQYTDELAQDAIASALTDNTDVTWNYNDPLNQISATLAASGVSAGTYGTASQVSQVTFDAKGRATVAANVAISILSTAVSDFNEAAQDAVGNIMTDSADVDFTYSDAGNTITAVLTTSGVVAGTYGTASQVSQVTFDSKGRATTASNVAISILSTAVSDFNEAAQDAVGNILTDSAEIDFTYSDAGNTITAVLLATTVTPGSYGGAITVPSFTVDSKGRLTAASTNTAITAAAISAQPHDAGLDSVVALSTNGFVVRTAASTFTSRSLSAGTGMSITNPTGAAGDPVISTTITQYTDELAQDAIGGALTDTASVDLVYDDTANQIKANVIPGGVDHNSLLNFDANKHIDHTAVQIATAATDGLSGGGTIAATRNLALNFSGLTAIDRIATTDQFAIYDASASAHKKVSLKTYQATRYAAMDQAYSRASDFIVDNLDGLAVVGAGAGNSTQAGIFGQDSVEKALGISESDTGTTSTGRRTVTSDIGSLTTSLARLRIAVRYAPNQLSNGTDTFTCYVGFINNSGAGEPTAGAYFLYSHGVNSGKWQAVTAEGTATPTRTKQDTGVTATNTYSIFEVEFNEAGTSATFYIDGTLVNTISTTIPPLSTTANTTFGYGWKIEKSVGTAVVAASTDWYFFETERTNAR